MQLLTWYIRASSIVFSMCHRTAAPPPQICVEDAAEDGADGGGGNFIVIVPGANDLLLPEHVAEATDRLKGAKVVLVSTPTWSWP